MTIWWCGTHGAQGFVDPIWGTMGCSKRGTVGGSCVLAEMHLIPVELPSVVKP